MRWRGWRWCVRRRCVSVWVLRTSLTSWRLPTCIAPSSYELTPSTSSTGLSQPSCVTSQHRDKSFITVCISVGLGSPWRKSRGKKLNLRRILQNLCENCAENALKLRAICEVKRKLSWKIRWKSVKNWPKVARKCFVVATKRFSRFCSRNTVR